MRHRIAINKPVTATEPQAGNAADLQDAETKVPEYVIEKLERADGAEYAYLFRITLNEPADMRIARVIKEEMRRTVAEAYSSTYGKTSGSPLQIDFPDFSVAQRTVSGKAVVMKLDVVSLTYDSSTSKGMIKVKTGGRKFEDVREAVRRNIETIVRDKNIALVTGDVPPQARFFLGSERVVGGDMLEIEFEAE